MLKLDALRALILPGQGVVCERCDAKIATLKIAGEYTCMGCASVPERLGLTRDHVRRAFS